MSGGGLTDILRRLWRVIISPPPTPVTLTRAEVDAELASSAAIDRSPDVAGLPQTYCFIISGNESLIRTTYNIFRDGLPVPVARLSAPVDLLREAAVAVDVAIPVAITRYVGTNSENFSTLATFLDSVVRVSTHTAHVVAICAGGEALVRVHLIYNQLLTDAMAQRILPFPMFSTKHTESAQLVATFFRRNEGDLAPLKLS